MTNYLEKEFYELIQNDKSIFDFIQQKSIDGVWYWDLNNPDNEWLSDKFWTDLGYDPITKKNKSHEWKKHIFPEDLVIAESSLKRHIEDPSVPYDIIIRYKHKNGSTVYIHSKALAIIDKEGKPYRVLGVRNNITEAMLGKHEREINEKLKKTNRELEHKNQSLKEFSYLTSHDLQSPLNTIISYLSLLNEEKKDMSDIAKLSIENIEKSTYRMKDFVTSLLNFVVIGKNEIRESFCIKNVIDESLESLESKIKRRKAFIKIEVPKEFSFTGNKRNIQRVFFNLIENSLKYAKENNDIKISIKGKKYNDHYLFSIADNGIGISENDVEIIFNPFKKLHSKDDYEGHGIGLAECKKIIELHYGEIWVKSVFNEGSTFYFKLPI